MSESPRGESRDLYAPPASAVVEATAGESRIWRDGKAVVVPVGGVFPDRCLRCNAPADVRLKQALSWHHPLVYLCLLANIIVYIVVALMVRKTMSLELPLCVEHARRRRRSILWAWLSLAGVFVVPFVVLMVVEAVAGPSYSDAFVFGAVGISFLLFLATFLHVVRAQPTRSIRMTKTHGWFLADPAVLASCPPLPPGS